MTILMYILQSAMDASTIALTAATFLAPFLTQITKRYLSVDSLWAYALHVGISAGLTLGAMALTGELHSAGDFATKFGLVNLGAQTIFRLFKADSGLNVEPSKPDEPKPPVE